MGYRHLTQSPSAVRRDGTCCSSLLMQDVVSQGRCFGPVYELNFYISLSQLTDHWNKLSLKTDLKVLRGRLQVS